MIGISREAILGAILGGTLAALAAIAAALGIGLILVSGTLWLRSRKAGTESHAAAFALIGLMASTPFALLVAWIHWPPARHDVELSLDASLEFAGFSAGRIRETGFGLVDHQIWGDLRLDIELPDRKRVRGRAERLSAYESDAGLYCLTLFYEPSPDTSPPVDYWVEGGSPMERHAGGSVRVDRGSYTAQVRARNAWNQVQLHLEFPTHRTPSVSPTWLCH